VRAAPTALRGIARAGAYQGFITGTTEAIRNAADPTIPAGESVTAAIGSAVMGALIGSTARMTRPATVGVGRFIDGAEVDAAALARAEGTRIVRPEALPGEITESMVASRFRSAITAEEAARGGHPTPAMLGRMTPEERAAWQTHMQKPPPFPPGGTRAAEALPTDVPPTIGRTPQGDDWGELPGDRTRGQGSRVTPPADEPASIKAAKAEAQQAAAAAATPEGRQAAMRLAEPERAELARALRSLSPEAVQGLSDEAKEFSPPTASRCMARGKVRSCAAFRAISTPRSPRRTKRSTAPPSASSGTSSTGSATTGNASWPRKSAPRLPRKALRRRRRRPLPRHRARRERRRMPGRPQRRAPRSGRAASSSRSPPRSRSSASTPGSSACACRRWRD
jgi:hypothetical protein